MNDGLTGLVIVYLQRQSGNMRLEEEINHKVILMLQVIVKKRLLGIEIIQVK